MKADTFEEIILRSNSNMHRLEKVKVDIFKKSAKNKHPLIYNPFLNKYLLVKNTFLFKHSSSLSNKSKMNEFQNLHLKAENYFYPKLNGFLLNQNVQNNQIGNKIKRNSTSLFMQNCIQFNPERSQCSSKIIGRINKRNIFNELINFTTEKNNISSNFYQQDFQSKSNLSSYIVKLLFHK